MYYQSIYYEQEFLKRLNQKSSFYNVLKWEEDFRKKEKLMRSMSEFPQFYDDREKGLKLKGVHKEYMLPEIAEKVKNKTG